MLNIMDKNSVFTSDYISRAVNEVRKIKPDFGLLLDLYERIYIEQENSKNFVRLDDCGISDESLSEKMRVSSHMVDISQFVIDSESAAGLFAKLCDILLSAGNGVAESVEKLAGAVDNKSLRMDDLFSAFMRGDESFITGVGNRLGVDAQVLGFVIYNSVKPSLNMFSRKISDRLDAVKEWDGGRCPVCGSAPELSVFEDNGKRSLLCGFCGHQWPSKRVYCSFCGNSDHETVHYFEVEGEEEYRVDVCDKCRTYVKTVDIKKTTRTVYLPLENVVTPYIDIRFKEMGYTTGNAVSEQ